MQRTARFYLSPLAALVTVAIGVGFVRAAEIVKSLFEPAAAVSREHPTEENIGVTSTENFRSFLPHATHGRVLACYDPNILPIWHELKHDEEFKDRLDQTTGVMNCSDMIEIEKVDLNFDGPVEFLVRGKGPHLCSAVGNCGFWIFELKESKARKLLTGSDYYTGYISEVGEQVQRSRTGGYSDILLAGHSSASETSYRTYKYDGRQYVESRCMYEIPKIGRDGEGSWELLTCNEFEHRRRD